MVQILPYVPTPLEQLTPYITDAAGKIGSGIKQRSALKGLQSLLNPQATDPGQPGTPQAQQAKGPFNPIDIAQIANMAETAYGKGGGEALTTSLLQQQKSQEKEAAEIRKETRAAQTAISQKKQEQDIGKRTIINDQRRNLKLALNSVQSGDVGAFGINSFADMFGEAGKRFKGAKAVQFDTATKGLLFDNINKVSAKGTNLWLEKVAKTALPELGKSEAANETLITIGLANLDLEEKQLDLQDELSQKYIQAGLPVPANIEKLTNDLLKPYAEQVENKMAYDTRRIYEREKGPNFLRSLEKVPKGTPLTREKRDALVKIYRGDKEKAWQKAQELGYVLPDSNALQPAGGG